jgi:hypothetical protein
MFPLDFFRIMAIASWRETAKGTCVRKKSSTIAEVCMSMGLYTGPPIVTTSIANTPPIGIFFGIASGVEARNWS